MIYNYPFYMPQNYYKFNTYNNSLKIPPKVLKSTTIDSYAYENSSAKTKDKTDSNNDYNPFFELFGIKLYFDDILLICLIFFLYNEGVKDDYLFISLILLLLS